MYQLWQIAVSSIFSPTIQPLLFLVELCLSASQMLWLNTDLEWSASHFLTRVPDWELMLLHVWNSVYRYLIFYCHYPTSSLSIMTLLISWPDPFANYRTGGGWRQILLQGAHGEWGYVLTEGEIMLLDQSNATKFNGSGWRHIHV